MILLENLEVMGLEHAIRGMRNPMNSWDKSDSCLSLNCDDYVSLVVDGEKGNYDIPHFKIGTNDHNLMMKLAKAGSVHGKFRRMIAVYVDVTAPLYWWKEFDTYKVGTVANSCSTMHKIHAKEFTIDDFSYENLISDWNGDNNDAMYYWKAKDAVIESFASPLDGLKIIMGLLNSNREAYLKTKDKKYWWQMIQLLPSSYNQKRTVMLNYEVLAGIYQYRRDHKLDEWRKFCQWIEELPWSDLITIGKEDR